MKRRLLFILFTLIVFAGCVKQEAPKFMGPDESPYNPLLDVPEFDGHFGMVRAADTDYDRVATMGITWDRLYPGIKWGDAVHNGEYTWVQIDKLVRDAQQYPFRIVMVIWPYSQADQVLCHSEPVKGPYAQLGEMRYKPCDMEAYSKFVEALVERYDGDGFNDLTGLKKGIKHWEVMTHVDVQEGGVFFKGTPHDYFDILTASYTAIKKADKDAKVLHAGMSSMDKKAVSFWRTVYGLGAKDYFNIANIHSVGDSYDFNVPEFKALLGEYGIEKPIWVTEAAHVAVDRAGNPIPENLRVRKLIEAYTRAFAAGADKIFDMEIEEGGEYEEVEERMEPYSAFGALEVLIRKIDPFDSASNVTEGHYKFTVGLRTVYVLWIEHITIEHTELRVTTLDGKEQRVSKLELPHMHDVIIVEPISR